jgi:hypothetical protein
MRGYTNASLLSEPAQTLVEPALPEFRSARSVLVRQRRAAHLRYDQRAAILSSARFPNAVSFMV